MLDPVTQDTYSRLAAWIADSTPQWRPCPVIGINGSQGSGKSSLGRFLCDTLQSVHGLRAALLAIDDFYLPLVDRQTLARKLHPLLLTRGVPGTHDPALGLAILEKLRTADSCDSIPLPRFSKALDDRLPESEWLHAVGPFDLILFEGWCVGLPAQEEQALTAPVNELEASDDPDGRWRRQVNDTLRGPYAEWFAELDALIFLQIPDFGCVRRWRWQQELETAEAHRAKEPARGLMTQTQLERFLQHYERLTEHALRVLPAQADVVLALDHDHVVSSSQLP